MTTSNHPRSMHSVLRGLLPALCAIGLAFTLFTATQEARQAQAPTPSKRALTHQDYDAWRSIQGQTISRDGRFAAYALLPQDGDGEIVVRDLAKSEWRAPRGWRPPQPPPDFSDPTAAQTFLASMSRISRPVFSADSRFVLFTIEPNKADVLNARKEKKKPEEMPKNALGIMDLSNGQVTRIERVKSFQAPEDGVGYVAYLLDQHRDREGADAKKPDATPPANPQPASGSRNSRRKEYGTDLVLRNLATGTERTLADALEYSFSKDARTLVYTVSSKKEETNGVYAVTPGGIESGAAPADLLTGKGKYSRLSWDEDQTQLAFTSDRDAAASEQPKVKIYHWDRKAAKATEIISTATPNFRAGLVVSDRANLSFAQDGSRLFFGVARLPEPRAELRAESEKDQEAGSADEKVVVDLWHWKDDYIQPMQKVRAETDRNRSYRAVWHIKERKLVQLADEALQTVTPSSNGLWAVGSDDRAYRIFKGQDTRVSDYYLVNTLDGSRKPIAKTAPFSVSLSPGGKYAIYFDGKDWNSVSIPDGKVANLSAKLGVPFHQEDHDTPDTPPSHGVGGWVKDDKYVLINDGYDIWQIAPDASSAKNLTDGVGRKEKTEFRYVRLDPQERAIDPAKPLLLRAENQWTRDSGFYRDRIDGGAPEKLMMAAKNFGQPVKAKNADTLLLSATRFDEYPDLHVADANFKTLKKVSNAGAQMDQFQWGKAELVRFKNADGVPLSGMLIKPGNFDPSKKYPMIVYIYEKLSNGLHRFTDPRPGHSINASYYASNGYLVLMPDIVYDIGYPGQSAIKCVLPAVQAVVDQGFVDEKAIGIQGHSWGGYQIAYMVTQTNRFRAAAPGALVGNMTSAYSGIRWGTGLARQFQYERTQSRIGGSLWEYPMRFIENSPIFQAHRIQTPILMLHNDEDDAVPWYQGIEYYLALRRLDKEAYLFNYNGEKHGIRKRQNQKDYTRRIQEFFDHNLKGAPKPDWMEKGIPYLQREKEKEKYRTASDGKETARK